jgi:hypothetical protein
MFDLADSEREIMEQGLEVYLDSMHTANSEGCGLGWVAEEDAEQTIQLLRDNLGLETDLEPAAFYDNEFVQGC